MRVIVIGAGVVGLASAWALARKGFEVVVFDRAQGPGCETSYANGALLTPSMADPWNSPGCWKTLLASLARADTALQLRLKALPSLSRWGLRFLWNSRRTAFTRHTIANLRLALESIAALDRLCAEGSVEPGPNARGSIRLFRDQASLDRAGDHANLLAGHGVEARLLSRDDTIALEPGLAPVAAGIAGAYLYPIDEASDAYRFCRSLAGHLKASGVSFRYGEEVVRFAVGAGRLEGVVTRQEMFPADAVLVAAGSFTQPLLQMLGLSLPIRPVKGYSLTIDVTRPVLARPIVDDARHAVLVPLNGQLRAAGTAEFAGFDRRLRQDRIDNLVQFVRAVLPQTRFDSNLVTPWAGLRAVSTDGVPIIGETRIEGLWVNTGHGHLGWTMAAGSGALVADLIAGDRPGLDPAPYAPARFRL